MKKGFRPCKCGRLPKGSDALACAFCRALWSLDKEFPDGPFHDRNAESGGSVDIAALSPTIVACCGEPAAARD
jgi:hypothetical protein